MDYKILLKESYETELPEREESRLEFLSENVFDFTTYDGAMSELFARKAIEVCAAISNRTTFEYIRSDDDYRWFLLMCNLPFFSSRIEWGTSIRGARWDHSEKRLNSCGLWKDEKQISELTFSPEQWLEFIKVMIEFAQPTK